jgi:PEGA domain-containing protein
MSSGRILLLLLAALAGTGCATVFAKKSMMAPMSSDPSGAEVFVDGHRVGQTPITIELSHRREHVIGFRKAGYKEATCTIGRSVGAVWIVLDVVFGLVPVIIDAATGSWYGSKPKVCNVTLPSGR